MLYLTDELITQIKNALVTMWCSYGLNYAFAYACLCDTCMGHYMWSRFLQRALSVIMMDQRN
jgi:hypothetical protein